MGGGSQDRAARDESLPRAVVRLEEDRFLRVNEAFARVLGLGPEELMKLGPLALTHPADRDRVVAMLGLMRAGSMARAKFRQRWLPAGDRPMETLVEGSVIQGDDGAPVAFAFTLETTSRGESLGEQAEQPIGQRRPDGVTGLPDAVQFVERLERMLAGPDQPSLSVLVLGVEAQPRDEGPGGRSREVDLLRAIAGRLEAKLGPDGFVARLGDRSFGILLATRDELTIAARARCLLKATSRPSVASDEEDPGDEEIHATVGVALAGRSDDDARELIDAADHARRRARELGSDRFEFSEVDDQRAGAPAHQLSDEVRDALRREELRLRYQPIFDLSDRRIRGVEALLRWEHRSRTVLPPEVFLPTARRTGVIVPIGRWVLEQALRQLARWGDELTQEEPLRLYVNLSARELVDSSLVDAVAAAIDRTPIEPGQLALEVPDAALIDARGAAWRSVAALRELGALIVLDQFGTAFSSLVSLERLPIDTVKLDRSLVAGIADDARGRAIAKAVVGVAEARGVTVIACGVETERQANALVALGCHAAQGFLFAEPRAARAVTKLLRWNGERAGRQAS